MAISAGTHEVWHPVAHTLCPFNIGAGTSPLGDATVRLELDIAAQPLQHKCVTQQCN
jgi:hypothetical protein